MSRLLPTLLLITACSVDPETAPPDATPASAECLDYCAWEHGVTGVSEQACVAECEDEGCADCCSTTPQWPGCPAPDPDICCPDLCAEYAPDLDPAYCKKACESNCAVHPEECCTPPS